MSNYVGTTHPREENMANIREDKGRGMDTEKITKRLRVRIVERKTDSKSTFKSLLLEREIVVYFIYLNNITFLHGFYVDACSCSNIRYVLLTRKEL